LLPTLCCCCCCSAAAAAALLLLLLCCCCRCCCDYRPVLQASVLSSIIIPGNQLTGTIPRSWTNLPWLSTVDVSSNDIGGNLPEEFAFQSRLVGLLLRDNSKLVGSISPWFR
jgi:hypothetical protein